MAVCGLGKLADSFGERDQKAVHGGLDVGDGAGSADLGSERREIKFDIAPKALLYKSHDDRVHHFGRKAVVYLAEGGQLFLGAAKREVTRVAADA